MIFLDGLPSLRAAMSAKAICPVCKKAHSGECRYLAKPIQEKPAQEKPEKTVCPICKRAHLGECRYAAKNSEPAQEKPVQEKPEKTVCPICKRAHLGECRYAAKNSEPAQEKPVQEKPEKTVCPICKRAHLGECRYAAKNSEPAQEKPEKPAQALTISPKFVCKNVTWYYTELRGNKRVFFSVDAEMLQQLGIATGRNFEFKHENFFGISMLPDETPEEVAKYCCNTIDAIRRGVIKFDYRDNGEYDSFIEDDTDELYAGESDPELDQEDLDYEDQDSYLDELAEAEYARGLREVPDDTFDNLDKFGKY